MKVSLFQLKEDKWFSNETTENNNCDIYQLILCFAAKEILKRENIYEIVKQKFPGANIAMCSTAGEIYKDVVLNETFVAVAFQFDKTTIASASINITNYENSYKAAEALVKKLPQQGLVNILVFSDGSKVNGSNLVNGLNDSCTKDILITGGLAGDGASFVSTLVGLNEKPVEGNIIAIGFYGDNILVSHGSQGGWEMFGLEKEVTKSNSNILYEVDNKNALDLYKKYLGPDAENLPGSALLFPLSVIIPGSSQPVVRTILSIDETNNSMTFAGDIPVGSKVRFMKGNFDKLTAAASNAAKHTIHENKKPDFSLLISCVGRKLALGSRIDEEVEAVNELLGSNTTIAGFYSYGEISPFNEGGRCQLHNQTMTITSFYER